jgi:uncharacterized protein YjbK
MSRGGREIELKLRVPDKEALLAVADVAGGERASPVLQHNHFFDSEERALRRHGFGLRLREEGASFLLTAKGPGEQSESVVLSLRREEEFEIPATLARAVLLGEHSPLEALRERVGKEGAALCLRLEHLLGGATLSHVGSFKNERTRIATRLPSEHGPLAVTLELDETRFPHGHVHHEVELELDEEADFGVAERALRSLLHLAGVEGFPSCGKAARFFAALDGERSEGRGEVLPHRR